MVWLEELLSSGMERSAFIETEMKRGGALGGKWRIPFKPDIYTLALSRKRLLTPGIKPMFPKKEKWPVKSVGLFMGITCQKTTAFIIKYFFPCTYVEFYIIELSNTL